jgi:hypothetical protein
MAAPIGRRLQVLPVGRRYRLLPLLDQGYTGYTVSPGKKRNKLMSYSMICPNGQIDRFPGARTANPDKKAHIDGSKSAKVLPSMPGCSKAV